ncbi:MAG: thioredoxin TrxC [Planctomycetota bacterium]|nr:MAG: thioredoxin TrxC [Planctomycetota bacterium]
MAQQDTLVLKCTNCGASNRVPVARVADRPVCGKCKSPLPPVAEPVALDDTSFDRVLQHAELPVLVDFWATWCGPCRAFAPTLAEYARQRAGQVLVAKVDVDRAPQTAARFRIQAVPTIAVFRGGREVARQAGAVGPAELDRLVNAARAA